MASLSDLVSRVSALIQDSTFSDDDIASALNRSLIRIAGGVMLPNGGISPPLPELYTTGAVTTDTAAAYVALPTSYQRDVVMVYSSAQDVRLRLLPSFRFFLRQWEGGLDEGGSIIDVAVNGRNLWYQPVPSVADTLTVHFHRAPSTLSDDADEPEGIPAHLHYDLLVNDVCREIYESIEDGLDGRPVNTEKHLALFERALSALVFFVGNDGVPENVMDDKWWR